MLRMQMLQFWVLVLCEQMLRVLLMCADAAYADAVVLGAVGVIELGVNDDAAGNVAEK